jgi:hypothetical protein
VLEGFGGDEGNSTRKPVHTFNFGGLAKIWEGVAKLMEGVAKIWGMWRKHGVCGENQ